MTTKFTQGSSRVALTCTPRRLLHNNGQLMSNSYVYCDEDDIADKSCTGSTGAYTWDDLGYFWASHLFERPYLLANGLAVKSLSCALPKQFLRRYQDPHFV